MEYVDGDTININIVTATSRNAYYLRPGTKKLKTVCGMSSSWIHWLGFIVNKKKNIYKM